MVDLNQKQSEAVLHTDGPLLILAGAGSGKTRVLTCRISHLIHEKNISPWDILAVTFTNKAAGEMKERISKMGKYLPRDMWVSTFHSLCLRLLRKHASLVGYENAFTIYDDQDQLHLINQCLEELKMNPKVFAPRAVAYRINQSKNQGKGVKDFSKAGLDYFEEKVLEVYYLYQKKLVQSQAMDFGDLILNTVNLFKNHPEILEFYQNQFRYLHVDEYQDTNRCQYLFISMLAAKHRNICVVWDDDQSIYKFRGAEIRNILDFQKDYPETLVVKLEQNYRSTQNILTAASAVVSKNSERMGKTLWTQNNQGDPITLFQGLTEKDEASFVVGEILQWKEKKKLTEMAIFYRTHAQSRPLEDELRRNRIPYLIVGGMKFYDRMEVKDMFSYLKVLVNPADAIALKRIINVPTRGIGKTTLEKLKGLAAEQGVSLWDILVRVVGLTKANEVSEWLGPLFNSGTLTKLIQFADLIEDLNCRRKETDLVGFMTQLFERSGYWKFLEDEHSIEAESRMENFEELVNVVADYVKNSMNPSLEEFLDQVALVSEVDRFDENADYLPLMTLHLAKGLEFPVVFLVGMEEGLFPHSRSLDKDDDVEEERRLCYVGMTRAMEKLYLSHVRERQLFGSAQYNLPSRFLEEIPKELINFVGAVHCGRPVFGQPRRGAPTDFDEHDQRGYEDDFDQSQKQHPFKRGTRVRHPQFGVGTIRASEGMDDALKLTVAFSSGQIKKLLLKYANLEILG